MKSIILTLLTLLSFSIFGIPVEQEEIDRLNTLLSFTDTEKLQVRISAAERDEQTNNLTSIDTESLIKNDQGLAITLLLGLEKISQGQVQIRGGLKGKATEEPLTNTQLLAMLTMISSLTNQLDRTDHVEATFRHHTRLGQTVMDFALRSTSNRFELLEVLIINAVIPRGTGEISGSIAGTLNYQQSLIDLVIRLLESAKFAS